MPGRADRNLRSGNLNEDLGVLILSSFCAVAPVPRPQDIGIDVIGTLLRPEGNRTLFAEESFYVQIKSESVDKVEFIDEEYEWFKRLELPYFLARVDAQTAKLELFSPAMSRVHFIENNYRGISFSSEDYGSTIERNGVRLATFGVPVLSAQVQDITDKTKLRRFYEIIKMIVNIERQNRHLIRVRTMNQLTWATNEIPKLNGQMTLVNVGYEKYQQEVLDVLLETLRGSLLAFVMSDRASLDAIMPLLAHAQKKSRLTDEDRKQIGILLHIFEQEQARLQNGNNNKQ